MIKQLTCEMCGGTDLVKQEGVFVCQNCGCKYSVEEAKKMMIEGSVEVSGTVKVDQSTNIENYLMMIKNALEISDIDTGLTYCNKIFELDPLNHRAWAYKSKMIAWNSSINDDKLMEAMHAIQKTLELTPEDEMEAVADDLYFAVETPILALIDRAACMVQAPYKNIHDLFLKWLKFLMDVEPLSWRVLDHAIKKCDEMAPNQKASPSMASDIMPSLNRPYNIYSAWKIYNEKEAYSVTFRRLLLDRCKEAWVRFWGNYPEIKALLDSELDRLVNLEKDALSFNGAREIAWIQTRKQQIETLLITPISDEAVEENTAFIKDPVWEQERQNLHKQEQEEYEKRLEEKEALIQEQQEQELIIANNKKLFGSEGKLRREAQSELDRIKQALLQYSDI